ncbi:unnamed protein product [Meloidogyne enterolobii]|uniref:Uncharacterized protein n=1 Tax=Meloidogyne enterolobii TaxID=390850 RepID=A0ACB1A0Q4_MELEN
MLYNFIILLFFYIIQPCVCFNLSRFETLETRHRKGIECWRPGDDSHFHYFGYRNHSYDKKPCLKWIDVTKQLLEIYKDYNTL